MGVIKTVIDRKNDLTINTATGTILIGDILAAVKGYLSQPPTRRVLWNFLEADGSGISSKDLEQLQTMVAALPGASTKRKIAVVIHRDLGFGLSRASGTYAEIAGVQAEHHIVRTLDEAMSWLGLPHRRAHNPNPKSS